MKVTFPSYNCPECSDGRYFCPPPLEVPTVRVGDEEMPLLEASDLPRRIYQPPCCGYWVAVEDYFKDRYGKPVRPFAVAEQGSRSVMTYEPA